MTFDYENTRAKHIAVVGCTIVALMTGMAIFKSCNEKNKDQDIPDVVYKARAEVPNYGYIDGIDHAPDTTVKPQVKTRALPPKYSLTGMSDTLVNLLWLQINSPLDVTPRQLNTLKDWVQRNLRTDTTNKQ